MPLAEFLKDPKPAISSKDTPPPLDPAKNLRKQVILQSGLIIAVGLALTAWYVGYRIFNGRNGRADAPPPAVVAAVPVPVSTPVSSPAPAPVPVQTEPEPEVPAVKSFPTTGPMPPTPAVHPKPINAAVSVKPKSALDAATSAVTKPLVTQEILEATRTAQPTKHKESSAVPFARHEAAPRPGERYLQIAAFGPHALDGYLKTLESQGLRPVVAPGPVDNIYRILIGPLPNAVAFEETRRLIQASGIEPIVRVY